MNNLLIVILMAAAGMTTKLMGLGLAFIILLTLLIYYMTSGKGLRVKLGYIFRILYLVLLFYIFFQIQTVSFCKNDVFSLTRRFSLQWIEGGHKYMVATHPKNIIVTLDLPTIFNLICRRMFTYADWHIMFFAFLITLGLRIKTIFNSNLKYILALILFNFMLLYYVFSRSEFFKYLVDGTLIQRQIMPFSIIVLFFIALAWGQNRIAKKGGDK